MNPVWRQKNLICALDGEKVDVIEQPLPTIPVELLSLFEVSELKKYMTPDELAVLGASATKEK
jgi:succinate dehydrogenase / fumarate reductase flavoprotein subunit